MGGYLTNAKGDLICALIDFIDAISLTYAEISTLEMSAQFILEEVGCPLHDLNFCSYSRILVSMLNEDYIPNWEIRFAYNRMQSIKNWFNNMSFSFIRKSKFSLLAWWKSIAPNLA